MSKTKIIVVSILSVISICLGSYASYAIALFKSTHDNKFSATDLGINVESSTEIVNFALFGVDKRPDDTEEYPRSDSIMILTLDYKHNKIKLTSILRDSAVYIDRVEGLHDAGEDKITHAYYYGGPELAVKTINQNFKLDIQEYATVDFSEMAQIIDAVGGIDLEITDEEAKHANGTMLETAANNNVEPDFIDGGGLKHLSGMQAVEYARIRVANTADGVGADYGRTDRQRRVMEQLLNEALAMSALSYPSFAQKVLPLITTSVGLDEVLSHVGLLSKSPTFEQMRMPNDDITFDDQYYIGDSMALKYDLNQASIMIRQFIYEDDGVATELANVSSSPSSTYSSDNTYYTAPSSTYTPPAYEEPTYEEPTYEEPSSEEEVSSEAPSESPSSEEPKPSSDVSSNTSSSSSQNGSNNQGGTVPVG